MLSLLHLGSISHLPSFTSLQFLLGEVFPRLSAETVRRFRLTVVGTVHEHHERTRQILSLASPFPNIEFAGFATDLREVYAAHHAQIVASTQGAGIRTRVVESLARGMPLIATDRSFSGLPGVEPGAHYAPLPDDPAGAARALEALVQAPESLAHLRDAGRALYRQRLSREVVAGLLRHYLTNLTGCQS
jgi:glycosyltransferase involved in cell wall biosynthesis